METSQRKLAHFHYEAADIDLGSAKIASVSVHHGYESAAIKNGHNQVYDDICAELELESNAVRWKVHSGWSGLLEFDAALHCCILSRTESSLIDLTAYAIESQDRSVNEVIKVAEEYFRHFRELFGNRLVCSTVLDFLELGPRGNHAASVDSVDSDKPGSIRKPSHEHLESAGKKVRNAVQTLRNEPAVGAAHVIKDYVAQSADELTLSVGEMISVIEMRRGEPRWRGKKWLEKADISVGYFPPDCVQLLGAGKQPTEVNVVTPKDVANQKHVGQLLSNLFASRPSKNALRRNGIMKERVFGCDLGEYVSALPSLARGVPPILTLCAAVLERFGLVDGVYRLSGSSSAIQTLRAKLDNDDFLISLLDDLRKRSESNSNATEKESGPEKKDSVTSESASVAVADPTASKVDNCGEASEEVDGAGFSKPRVDSDASTSASASTSTSMSTWTYSERPSWFVDVHSLASVLKTYFRELPNPLFTFELYSQFQDLVSYEASEQLVRAYKLIHQLPPPHYRTASALFRHLHAMATREARTNMGVCNLAIVWSPNLLRPKRSSQQTAADQSTILREMANQTVIVEFIIRNCTLLFSDKLIILRDSVPIADLPSAERVLMSIGDAQRLHMRKQHDDATDSLPDGNSSPPQHRSHSHDGSELYGDYSSASADKDSKKQSKPKPAKQKPEKSSKERLGPTSPAIGPISGPSTPPVLLPPRQTAPAPDTDKSNVTSIAPNVAEEPPVDLPIRLNIRRAIRADQSHAAEEDAHTVPRTPSMRIGQSMPRIAVKRATAGNRNQPPGRNTPPGRLTPPSRERDQPSPPNVNVNVNVSAIAGTTQQPPTLSNSPIVAPLSRVDEVDVDTPRPNVLRHAVTDTDLARAPLGHTDARQDSGNRYDAWRKVYDQRRSSIESDVSAAAPQSASDHRLSRCVLSPTTLTLTESNYLEIVSPVSLADEVFVSHAPLDLEAPVLRRFGNARENDPPAK